MVVRHLKLFGHLLSRRYVQLFRSSRLLHRGRLLGFVGHRSHFLSWRLHLLVVLLALDLFLHFPATGYQVLEGCFQCLLLGVQPVCLVIILHVNCSIHLCIKIRNAGCHLIPFDFHILQVLHECSQPHPGGVIDASFLLIIGPLLFSRRHFFDRSSHILGRHVRLFGGAGLFNTVQLGNLFFNAFFNISINLVSVLERNSVSHTHFEFCFQQKQSRPLRHEKTMSERDLS